MRTGEAARRPLPASTVSDARITVIGPDDTQETVARHIDASEREWVGQGCPVKDVRATIRISYQREGRPFWIDVPLAAWVLSLKPAAD